MNPRTAVALTLSVLCGCATSRPYSPTRVGVMVDFSANGEDGAPPVTGLVKTEFLRVLMEPLQKEGWEVVDLSDPEHQQDAKGGAIELGTSWGAAYVLHGHASFTSAKLTGMMAGLPLFPVLGAYSLQLVTTRERTVLATSEGKLPLKPDPKAMLISFDKTAVTHVKAAAETISAPLIDALKARKTPVPSS